MSTVNGHAILNGYTIHAHPTPPTGWLVRAYRDADDEHVHSSEDAPLSVALREAQDAITRDMVAEVPAPNQEDQA